MSFETLLLSRQDGVATVTLNRPERLNALNGPMHKELFQVWQEIRADDTVRVVILTGAGDRAFCSGADMKERGEAYARGGTIERDRVNNTLVPRHLDLSGFPHQHSHHDVWKPLICAVNGICAGGGNAFVGDSDVVLAIEGIYFMEPHVSVGMVPAGEMQSFAGRVPWGILPWLAYLGRYNRLPVERAHQLGLVQEVLPRDRLMERAREIATRLASLDPVQLQRRKALLWQSRFHRLRDNLDFGAALARSGAGIVLNDV